MLAEVKALFNKPGYAEWLFFRTIGFSRIQWLRIEQEADFQRYLRELPLNQLDCLEISPQLRTLWREIGFRSYTAVHYPEFDITKDKLDRQFDVIIAEHVFEHLRHPYAAAKNVLEMLKPGGRFLVVTPFLIRVHGSPHDYTRWTPDGLVGFLEDCGFEATAKAWGNRKAVKANLNRWAFFGWGRDLKNESNYPVTIWAYARKKT